MNRQTRFLRKANQSTYVVKGASVPKDGKPGLGTSLGIVGFDITKGRCVNSTQERAAGVTPNGHKRKEWKGCGDPLGRNK